MAVGLLTVAASFYFKEETVARGSLLLGIVILAGVGVHLTRRWRGPAAIMPWAELETRFENLHAREVQNVVHGDRTSGFLDAVEFVDEESNASYWRLRGATPEIQAEAERLFVIAGRRLLLIKRSLSPHVKRERDDFSRWVSFLVEVGNHEPGTHTVTTTERGRVEHWTYWLHEVLPKATAGCIEGMKREITR